MPCVTGSKIDAALYSISYFQLKVFQSMFVQLEMHRF